MDFCRFLAGIPEHRVLRLYGPIICLVQVTAMAAVKQVPQIIAAATSLRVKMVNGELAPGVRFRDSAIFTGAIGPPAHLFPKFC